MYLILFDASWGLLNLITSVLPILPNILRLLLLVKIHPNITSIGSKKALPRLSIAAVLTLILFKKFHSLYLQNSLAYRLAARMLKVRPIAKESSTWYNVVQRLDTLVCSCCWHIVTIIIEKTKIGIAIALNSTAKAMDTETKSISHARNLSLHLASIISLVSFSSFSFSLRSSGDAITWKS